MLSLPGLFLVANLISNLLLGAYASIAINCIEIFIVKFRHGQINWVHLISFIIISVVAITKTTVDNVVTINAFTRPNESGSPQYPSSSSPQLVTLNALWIIETMVADAFIIYRLWVVWHKKWILTIVPSVLFVGCFGAGIYNLWVRPLQATLDPAEYSRRINASRNVFTALTLGINVLCTGLIAYKIWNVRRGVASNTVGMKNASDPVKRVTNIIIESALIYTMHLLLIIVFTASDSPLAFLFTPIISPTIALVFGSIIVRSVNGTTASQTSHSGEVSTGHGATYLRSARVPGRDEASTHIGPGGLQVKLERVITSKVDGVDSLAGSDSKYRPDDV